MKNNFFQTVVHLLIITLYEHMFGNTTGNDFQTHQTHWLSAKQLENTKTADGKTSFWFIYPTI